MSLATTCPQCKTSFKVVPDQLKLRRGLVRCGICRHVFSGIDSLKYVEDPANPSGRPTPPDEAAGTRAPPGGAAPSHPVPTEAVSAQNRDSATLLHSVERAFLADAAGAIVAAELERADLDRAEVDVADLADSDLEPADREPAGREHAERESIDRESIDRELVDRDRDSIEHGLVDQDQDQDQDHAHAHDHDHDHDHGRDHDRDRERERGYRAPIEHEIADRERSARATTAGEGEGTSLIGRSRPEDSIPGRAPPETRRPEATGAHGVPLGTFTAVEVEAIGSPEDDAVDFFSTNERSRGFATRSSVFAALAACVLGVALALQLAIGLRDRLAAAVPALRPALAAIVSPLGLSVEPPRQLGALTIESFELQSAGEGGLLSMNALLRNAVDHPVRWPAIELSLSDGSGAVVVRKVLLPADYLAGATRGASDGVAARAEWPLRVALQAQGVEPTAYSAKLFYP